MVQQPCSEGSGSKYVRLFSPRATSQPCCHHTRAIVDSKNLEEHGHDLENCIYKQGGGLIQPQVLGCDPWSRSRQTQVEVETLVSVGPVGSVRLLQRTDTSAEGSICMCV